MPSSWSLSYLLGQDHKKMVAFKQQQRADRIAELPEEYKEPLTLDEEKIVATDAPTLHGREVSGQLSKQQVIKAFSKKALQVHSQTNALTEIMIKDTGKWAERADVNAPLGGVPISLKDPIGVAGYDSSLGTSRWARKELAEDTPLVKVLLDAGAIPYVKTNLPKTMFTIESYNDMFGVTHNPHKKGYSAGGSSSGEGALLGGKGSRIGIGSDIAGSVRVPGAFCGVASLRFTAHRWPSAGHRVNRGGFEAIRPTASPMAQTLPDLRFFIEGVFKMKPWEYDSSLIPMPWRSEIKLPSKPKIGVIWSNKYLEPTPAITRVLKAAADALKAKGYEVVDVELPRPGEEYAETISKLFCADSIACKSEGLWPGERNDDGVAKILNYGRKLPKFIRYIVEWFYYYVLGRKDQARAMRWTWSQSYVDFCANVARRDALRWEFNQFYKSTGCDFLLSPTHSSPALPTPFPDSIFTLEYTSLWNFLDYPAGVVPTPMTVDATLDKLPKGFDASKLNWISKRVFDVYDPVKMAGLPLAVQISAPSFSDEIVLQAQELVASVL